jgi:hypothetical protein
MRTQFAGGRRVMNHAEFAASIRAGKSPEIIAGLVDGLGLALDTKINGGKFAGIMLRNVQDRYNVKGDLDGKEWGGIDKVAFDAQPELVTVSNSGIPAFLSNYLDPALIEVLVTPMKAAEIAGETKKGDWVTTVTTFIVVESDGEVSAYGDYSNAGNADSNTNFPQRQSFHYQTFTRWGEKELAYTGLAGIDLASRKNVASALVLNKFQNKTYFFGVAGLQLYGLLNDPNLLPPIVNPTPWDAATADQVFESFRQLYAQAVRQANGLLDRNERMTAAMSPGYEANLIKTNQFGLNVYDLITKNFPNLTIKTAPEYSTASGELVQLIIENYEGTETLTAAFTEKMRAHAVVVGSSNFSQKKSQGTWGTVIKRPIFVAQMLG